MNRQGQSQPRQPTLAPNPNLAAQFRSPYTSYGPPRNTNVLQGSGFLPGLQTTSHRTPGQQQTHTQGLAPQPPPSFLQQRNPSSFAFGGALGQHQPSPAIQQPPSQQTNGNPPSVSSASEVGLDPNDFPALGSSPAITNGLSAANGSGANASTSYASQAGTGAAGSAGAIGSGSVLAAAPTREFTPDDFPALGGPTQGQGNGLPQPENQTSSQHPPGLNGFQQQQQTERQSLLGAINAGLQQGTPGLLNLGAARSVHPGFQLETEKQQRNNYAPMKLAQAAWSSPNPTPATQIPQPGAGQFSSTQAQNGNPANASSSHLGVPPGVPPLGGSPALLGSTNAAGATANALGQFGSNGLQNEPANQNSTQNPNSLPNSTTLVQQHPQTPAQQVLMSAADRWGLLGLLAMIKNADADQGLSGVGTDLGTMGLDMGYPGSLYSTFITPWADQSAAHSVEPDFHLPACYNVHPPAPGPSKASAFSDETLFFMFYSSPRDALQEVGGQELFNRNWRFHKELRLWLTKESGTPSSQKVPGGESGLYTYWDPESWMKERKEMTVMYTDLEDKSQPAFLPGTGLVPAQQGQVQQQQQQPSHPSTPQRFQ